MGILAIHRNIRIRLLVGFLFGTAQSTTLPFMAIYFSNSVGAVLTGTMLMFATAASLVAGSVGGYYCDRVGRRRVMIFGEFIFLLSFIGMALSISPILHSPWMTFAMFLLGNICFGVYGPADDAMVLDLTTPENRVTVFGMFYWMHNLTLALGSSIGAFLFEGHAFLLFSITAAVLLVSLLMTVFLIRETLVPMQAGTGEVAESVSDGAAAQGNVGGGSDGGQHASFLHVYKRVFRDTVFIKYIVGTILVASLEFGLNNNIGIHLDDVMRAKQVSVLGLLRFHLDGLRMVGILQTENTLIVVILATLAIRFVATRNQRQLLFWGLTLNAAGYVLMGVVAIPLVLMAAMLVATIGEIVNSPIRQGFLGDLAPPDLRSTYAAMNGMSWGAARLLASLAVVIGAIIPTWAMGVLSVIVGGAGIWMIQSVSRRIQPSPG